MPTHPCSLVLFLPLSLEIDTCGLLLALSIFGLLCYMLFPATSTALCFSFPSPLPADRVWARYALAIVAF